MRWTSALATLALVTLVAGCSKTSNKAPKETTAVAKIRSGPESTARDQQLKAGLLALEKGDYDKADIAFHTALNADPRDGLMHFMSGLSSHMQAKSGKTDSYQMAEVAYKASLSNEPSNKFASLQLARLYMETKAYGKAQDRYAEALLTSPNDAELMQGLASASYMARDMKTAYKAIGPVLEARPTDPEALRLACLINAALGKKKQADTYLAQLKTVGDDKTANYVEARIQDWSRIHTGNRFTQLAQADAPQQSAPQMDEEKPAPKNMAFVDLVLLRTEEAGIQDCGKNIFKQLNAQFNHDWAKNEYKVRDKNARSLNGLTPPIQGAANQVGAMSVNTPAANAIGSLGSQFASVSGGLPGFAGGVIPDYILNTEGYTLVKSFGLNAFNYALQIANTVNKSSEVIARPTLVALDGKMSSFFSGSQLVVGLTGTIGGGQLDRERIGIHLEFIPKFLKDGKIEFQVSYGRSFPDASLGDGFATIGNDFSGNNSPFGSTFQMAMGELSVNVVMNFGQTLILAGLSERETKRVKEGFPILKDIPLLQYFFAESHELDYHKHLVVMMTPRNPGFRAGDESPADRTDHPKRNLDRFLLAYVGNTPVEPNLKHTFAGLESNQFYKEFRTGDVSGDRWFHTQDRQYLINQTLDMFYF